MRVCFFLIYLKGVSQKDALCATCNQGLNECVGHFGYLDLALPVYHVGHFRSTIQILQSICKVSSVCEFQIISNTWIMHI